ncbi:hypothetical protein HDU97_007798 [Phlyctochytrium planicorne]|nr:hypothetical protein HDU97_007798 [Phlyctochytrium planicorne]
MNTILNKLQNLQCVENCDSTDPEKIRRYEQPVWQTILMFIGETMCLLVFYASSRRQETADPHVGVHPEDESAAPIPPASIVAVDETSPLSPAVEEEAPKKVPLEGWAVVLFWLPTLCDMIATTLMSIGLLYVSASVYQMLRGSVVLFTGALSTIFLGRRHPPHRWFALFTVFIGVLLVGVSSILEGGKSPALPVPSNPIGVFLIILAQTVTASQFVIEEKIMAKYEVPALRAVGLEGAFGLLSAAIFLPIIYLAYGRTGPKGNFFDIPAGWHETTSTPTVFYAGIGICFSIAFFNWSGLSVTTSLSATARSTIDTCRTVFIWGISLYLGWETFKYIQLIGFFVLVSGTVLFNCFERPTPRATAYQRIGDEEN